MSKISKVAYQVMWNRLISIVEEQAQALIRTAFSTSVREAGDLSAGVYTSDGEMLAQAVTGTPGHVNAMADSVAHFIRRIGKKNILEGDVYLTNDPWEGTGHLHDITVVTPIFFKRRLVSFFACTAHVVDVGGRGFGADANSVYEEGIYIPIMKFVESKVINQTLVKILRANVREPDQLIGDIHALATCNEIGYRRLSAMMSEFRISNLSALSEFIFSNSLAATLKNINLLKFGSEVGSMMIDGYDSPVKLNVKITIEKNKITCDWSGTSRIDKKGINVPLVYTKAYSCYALKCAIAPEVPNNSASLKPFEIIAEKNSIVNAKHPAPVALRHVIGHMLPDAIYVALDKLIPNLVPAEGAGCLCNFQVSLRTKEYQKSLNNISRAEVLTFNSGGSGARPTLDGMNATAFPSGVMTMPVEVTEQVGPIIIWQKELRPDSGGAGQFRGGLGQLMEVGASEGYQFDLQAMFDRLKFPARGRRGGYNGAKTTIALNDGTALKGKGKQSIPYRSTVKMAFPGGAGYGDPLKRDLDQVRLDLQKGYISLEYALKFYDFSIEELQIDFENSERC